MNKGDIILIVILLASLAFFGADAYFILHGYDQWIAGAWTCFGIVFGGELLSFALYRIGKSYSENMYLKKGQHVADALENDKKMQAHSPAQQNTQSKEVS